MAETKGKAAGTGCDVTNYGSDERKGAGTGCGVTKYDSDEWKGGGDWH